MPKAEQEFHDFRREFRKSMSAVIERLDELVRLVADDPAAPTPVPPDTQDPLPFTTRDQPGGGERRDDAPPRPV